MLLLSGEVRYFIQKTAEGHIKHLGLRLPELRTIRVRFAKQILILKALPKVRPNPTRILNASSSEKDCEIRKLSESARNRGHFTRRIISEASNRSVSRSYLDKSHASDLRFSICRICVACIQCSVRGVITSSSPSCAIEVYTRSPRCFFPSLNKRIRPRDINPSLTPVLLYRTNCLFHVDTTATLSS